MGLAGEIVLFLCSLACVSAPTSAHKIRIPAAGRVAVDGTIASTEWQHAATVHIRVSPGWEVKVLAQHDDKNLYIAFVGLRHGSGERYPEILLDATNRRGLFWTGGQWWFHASYNLCEGRKPNQYSSCRPTQEGWQATRFPRDNGVSEIAISLAKVGLNRGKPFGFAFDVTDTQRSWSFWPSDARLEVPLTWATATLE